MLNYCCLLCHESVHGAIDLCEYCLSELPWTLHACQQCGIPLLGKENIREYCGACLQSPPPFDHLYSACLYQPPISHFITALKFSDKLVYARLLSQLMLQTLSNKYLAGDAFPAQIIAVPLHKKRLRQRGFNQALEIAKPIARALQLPLDRHTVKRKHATTAQSLITDVRQRYINVKQAFSVNSNVSKHIALIDDVVTTGHTVAAISRLLKKHGAERIDVWCAARVVGK